jgi:2-dehydropantoate 2-reductase
MKTIAVIGTGAIGGYYGARLQQAGNEVHFLLHSDYDFVVRHGLTIDSAAGDIRLPEVHAHKSADTIPPCDLAIVSLKVTRNEILRDILPRILKPDGAALTLQNGMGADDFIAGIVGPQRVMGGLCFICSNKVGPGHIRHLGFGSITLGQYAAGYGQSGITPRLTEWAGCLRAAGIETDLVGDLLLGRWRKLVWNIPYNGMSVVMDATTDKMVGDPALRVLFRELMEEVRAGAAAFGRTIEPAFLDKMVAYTDKMPPYATSMMLDFLARRPMEVEAIYGNPMRLAGSRGVPVPRIAMLYRELCFINRRLENGQPSLSVGHHGGE